MIDRLIATEICVL